MIKESGESGVNFRETIEELCDQTVLSQNINYTIIITELCYHLENIKFARRNLKSKATRSSIEP